MRVRADSGVLIPISEKEEPDPALLSLDRFQLDISIDHLYARTRLVQIFQSHVGKVLEGKYVFALPREALIADFAVWDGLVRIPGVILERRKARNIYQVLRQQAIDPGLLQQGESEDPASAGLFSARIVPIPAFGTKRLELEYTEWIPLENGRGRYVFPLKPRLYRQQSADEFGLRFSFAGSREIRNLHFVSTSYPIEVKSFGGGKAEAVLEMKKASFPEDLILEFEMAGEGNSVDLLTHGPEIPAPYFADSADPKPADSPMDRLGYFFAGAITSFQSPRQSSEPAAGRSVVFLLDTSLSIQWEKLERSCEALFFLLQSLKAPDRFHLALFNRQAHGYRTGFSPATTATVSAAVEFVKSAMIEDGSDLAGALRYGLQLFAGEKGGEEKYLVVLTDGFPTLGMIKNKDIAAEVDRLVSERPAVKPVRICPIILGAEANHSLLESLASGHNGFTMEVRETEEGDFLLRSFAARMGSVPFDDLSLQMENMPSFSLIYPVRRDLAFPGSYRAWVGRYTPASNRLQATVTARQQGRQYQWSGSKTVSAESLHTFLPRSWAKARVDALIRQIEMEGESEPAIEEIIRLSKRYRFVTPYTSFLAAPRSLLRPRMIQPGDPVLRIHTDPSIAEVTAVFPFGLVKPMSYLSSEKLWQTRFLAPAEMSDGRYDCKLILRDQEGRSYLERKSFLVDSRAPRLQPRIDKEVARGKTLSLRVGADSDTRRIQVSLGSMAPVRLHWDEPQKMNCGEILIPADLPPGTYVLRITAEDFAHNMSAAEQKIRVR